MPFAQVVAFAILQLIPLIMSLTVHEYAHAQVARWLGDDTAERAGRRTLNPAAHVDPVGTLALPMGLLLFAGATGVQALPFFAWAKPTPVSPGRMSRRISQRQGSLYVALCGPVSNFLFALLAAVGLASLLGSARLAGTPADWLGGLATLLLQLTYLNVGLALFNLIPLGSLDGHTVLLGLLPPRLATRYAAFNARFGVSLLLLLVFFGRFLLARPVTFVAGALLRVVGALQ